ncbi:MAG TPA: cupredoxin domain-containing protein [Terriglobales bacterium]
MIIKRLHHLLSALFVLFISASFVVRPAPIAAQNAGQVHEIQMTAKKYEFSPNPIRVKKGERVRLIITATDRDHGIKIEAFNVEQKLKKGVPIMVEFTADKAGTFPFKCSVHCGLGHGGMKGTLIVEE